MTMQDAFTEIFSNAFQRVDNNINFSETLNQLAQIKDCDYSTSFILELMKFFEKKYNQDILSMFSDYINKCNKSWVSRFSQLCESEEGL